MREISVHLQPSGGTLHFWRVQLGFKALGVKTKKENKNPPTLCTISQYKSEQAIGIFRKNSFIMG